MTPAGFLISSAEDLTHYLAAQLNGGTYEHSQVLSRQGTDTLHAPAASMSPASSYGMGWVVTGAPGSPRIWHDGDVSNFYSHLLLLPDQHLAIVVLMNVGAFGHTTAINNLVEGLTATFLGHGQAVPANSLSTALSRLTMFVPLLIAMLWAVWSLRSLRNSRLYLALVVDVCVIAVIWIVVSARFQTPMATIALFAPDVFTVVITITGIAVGCAIARTFIALRSRQLPTRLVINDRSTSASPRTRRVSAGLTARTTRQRSSASFATNRCLRRGVMPGQVRVGATLARASICPRPC